MSEIKKVFFIINKFAGTGYQDALEGRIIDYCAQQAWECTIEHTRQRAHATSLARQASQQGYKLVVAVGGDGTINETAQGLLGSATPMAILPKGSGNGLARHLGIPLPFAKALGCLHTMTPISIDTFTVNGILSVNVSGIGFDAHIANLFGKNGKRGLLGYAGLTLREFVRFPEFEATLQWQGQQETSKNFLIAIANSSQFGNNARIAPYASVRDGLLDICLVKKVPVVQAPAFAQRLFAGHIDRSRFVRLVQTPRLLIECPEPVAFHVDGEPYQTARVFTIAINPGSLRVLVPASTTHTP